MIRFIRPDVVSWGIVIPWLIAAWAVFERYRRSFDRRSPVPNRFAGLSRRSTAARSVTGLLAAISAAAALVVALMQPQAVIAERRPEYERQDLILILDRSVSMRAHDIMPSRFSRATLEIRNLLRGKPASIDRVGLVGFADTAVILSYLTADTDSLSFYLDWIDRDPTALFGTNIGAALESAREVAAKDSRPTKKVFLLVSDGEDHDTELEQMLARFRGDGVPIHAIGVGSSQPVPIPLRQPDGREVFLRDDAGRTVTTRFEESTLQHIALSTGGRYMRSTSGGELERAITDIVRGERRLVGWKTTTAYHDLYPAALVIAAAAVAALWVLL